MSSSIVPLEQPERKRGSKKRQRESERLTRQCEELMASLRRQWTPADQERLEEETRQFEQRDAELRAAQEEQDAKTQVTDLFRFRRKRLPTPEQRPDQHRYITQVAECDRKMAAENHQHEMSRDWDLAPEGTKDFFSEVIYPGYRHALQNGTEFVFRPSPAWKAQFEWLQSGNCHPLIEVVGDTVRMIADRPGDPQDPYPGCPANVNPLAGRYVGGDLELAVAALVQVKGGTDLTDRQRAAFLNQAEVRKLLGWQDRRYVSVEAVRKARKRAPVRMVRPAQMYRDRHRWALARPARYEILPGWEMTPPRKLAQLLTRFLVADEQYIRRRLEADGPEHHAGQAQAQGAAA